MSVKNIINGLGNYIFPSKKIEDLAKQRAIVCQGCEHAKEMMLDVFTDNTLNSVKKLACGKCHCPLSTKLRSEEEKCPLNKW